MKKTLTILLIFTVLITSVSVAFSQSVVNTTSIPKQVIITASGLNVRCGPSSSFLKVATVYRNQKLDCIGKIGTWYIVHLNNDTVGLVSGSYAKPYYGTVTPPRTPAPVITPRPTAPPTVTAPPTTTAPPSTGTANSDLENRMLQLINAERTKIGLNALTMNASLRNVARVKAQDMVSKNYFSHTSPTYGSPFDMMKQFGITYRSAGENLAGNSTVDAAHTALMNSPGHRANILNTSYTEIGIGVVNSPQYGKIFVQMFIGN